VEALGLQASAVAAQLRAATAAARPQAGAVGTQVSGLLRSFDEQLAGVRRELDLRIDEAAERLPDTARATLAQVRAVAAQREQALRRALGLDTDAPAPPEPTDSPDPGPEAADSAAPGPDPASEGQPPA
jgi:hypothetical protein